MVLSSLIVLSTFCSASARLSKYRSCWCTINCCDCCCVCSPPMLPAPPGEPPNRFCAFEGVVFVPPPCWSNGREGRGEPLVKAPEENRCWRLFWTLRFSVRMVSTSLNSFVVSKRRVFRLSTTVAECWVDCLLLVPSARVLWRSSIAALRAVMSCFTTPVSSWISAAGSSNMEVRLASLASLASFVEVE
eukprot:scaffold3428_cov379-Prasinococcus_capsulatus_cf.AAC.24